MTSALKTVRRIAASILGVGESRVWINPEKLEQVETAVTREDVRRLIKEGVISKLPPATPSRGRWRLKRLQIKKGRRRGSGRHKGPWVEEKEIWVQRIRAQRSYLKYLHEKGLIDSKLYRRLRNQVKGGEFRSIAHLKAHLKEIGLLKEGGVSG